MAKERIIHSIGQSLDLVKDNSNQLQIQICNDGEEAYIDLDLSDAKLLKERLEVWISEKEVGNG